MKNALAIFILALMASSMNAQTDRFEIGLEGGPDMANFTNTFPYANRDDNLYAFSAGITGQYNLNEHFSLKSGVIFEQKGFSNMISFSDNTGTFINNVYVPTVFSYLILPVYARESFGHKLKFFINGGPYFGYLLKATYREYNSNKSFYTQDFTRELRPFDIGASAGIGIERKIGKRLNLNFEGRYNYGFLSVLQGSSNSPYGRNESVKSPSWVKVWFKLSYCSSDSVRITDKKGLQ